MSGRWFGLFVSRLPGRVIESHHRSDLWLTEVRGASGYCNPSVIVEHGGITTGIFYGEGKNTEPINSLSGERTVRISKRVVRSAIEWCARAPAVDARSVIVFGTPDGFFLLRLETIMNIQKRDKFESDWIAVATSEFNRLSEYEWRPTEH